jgi:ketosteroid isomerase-like protein
MSDLQLMSDLYAAFDRGDLDAIRPHLAPDFVLIQSGGLPWSGGYTGPDGFFDFVGKLFGHLETKLSMEQIYDAGGAIVQIGHSDGTVRSSGAAFRTREVHTSQVRDGRLVRLEIFVDADAMRSALRSDRSVAAS